MCVAEGNEAHNLIMKIILNFMNYQDTFYNTTNPSFRISAFLLLPPLRIKNFIVFNLYSMYFNNTIII